MAIKQDKNHQETGIHPQSGLKQDHGDYLNIREHPIKHHTAAEWDLSSPLTERSGLDVFIYAHTCSVCML